MPRAPCNGAHLSAARDDARMSLHSPASSASSEEEREAWRALQDAFEALPYQREGACVHYVPSREGLMVEGRRMGRRLPLGDHVYVVIGPPSDVHLRIGCSQEGRERVVWEGALPRRGAVQYWMPPTADAPRATEALHAELEAANPYMPPTLRLTWCCGSPEYKRHYGVDIPVQLLVSRSNPTIRLASKDLEASITPSTTFD